MEKEKNAEGFPAAKIKISLLICAALFAVGAMLMKNAAFVTVKTASLAASVGGYELAAGLLGNLENGSERYHEGLYSIAGAMYRRGDYELAYQKFSDLSDYSDSADMACRSRQKLAEQLIEAGDYEQASAMLSEIMYFDGSRDLYNECQYRYAVDEIEHGDWFTGAQMLWSMKDYKDSRERAEKAVLEQTGSDDAEATLGSEKPMSPAVLSEYLKLKELSGKLQNGRIAAGFYHTVGLKSDGTVVACGSNAKKQCNTDAWTDIVQVAAGGYHTVGLRADGTAVACGSNEHGQCNVKEWKDIVQIAATDYNTIALLKDGTVVTCGYNKLAKVKGWEDIEKIAGGSYAVCGLNRNRELVFTHPSCRLEGELFDADASISYAIGLTITGDVVYSSETPVPWEKAVSVYAGGESVGIIDQSFAPSVYDRRNARFYEIPSGAKAIAMSLGTTHFAVLFDDGSVYCDGENHAGQCDTAEWNLQ